MDLQCTKRRHTVSCPQRSRHVLKNDLLYVLEFPRRSCTLPRDVARPLSFWVLCTLCFIYSRFSLDMHHFTRARSRDLLHFRGRQHSRDDNNHFVDVEATSVIDFELAVGIGLGNILVCEDFNQSIFQFCYPDRIETSFPLCRASHPFLFGQQQPVAPVVAQGAFVVLQMLAPDRALQQPRRAWRRRRGMRKRVARHLASRFESRLSSHARAARHDRKISSKHALGHSNFL